MCPIAYRERKQQHTIKQQPSPFTPHSTLDTRQRRGADVNAHVLPDLVYATPYSSDRSKRRKANYSISMIGHHQQQQQYRSSRTMNTPSPKRIPSSLHSHNHSDETASAAETPATETPPRKSAWSTFTNWLATSFSSEDSDGSVDDEERDTGVGTGTGTGVGVGSGDGSRNAWLRNGKGNGKGRVGVGAGAGVLRQEETPLDHSSSSRRRQGGNRRLAAAAAANTNGFSPASGTNTSPSPVRHHQQYSSSPSSSNNSNNNNSPLGSTPAASATAAAAATTVVRPAFVRASTLRTIEEGDSPYGSYLSSSTIPSLRHLAAMGGSSSTAAAAGIVTGEGTAGNGSVRRSSLGDASGAGVGVISVVPSHGGMSMIQEIAADGAAEAGAGAEEVGKAVSGDTMGAVAVAVDGLDEPGMGVERQRQRSRSRSRSRSPNVPSLPPGHGHGRHRHRDHHRHRLSSADGNEPSDGSATLVNAEIDDRGQDERDGDGDPFYVGPPTAETGTTPAQVADERTRLLLPTLRSANPSTSASASASSSSDTSRSGETSGHVHTSTGSSLRTSTSNSKSQAPSSHATEHEREHEQEQEQEERETWKAWFHRFLRGPLFEAGWKFCALWIGFTVVLVGTIWLGLPRLDP